VQQAVHIPEAEYALLKQRSDAYETIQKQLNEVVTLNTIQQARID